jgi:multidrug resistance protein, MATE family
VNSAIFLTFKDNWGYMFSNDPDIIGEVSKILPLVALFQIVDGLAGVTGGILRAKGQQDIGALLNLVGYYVIGIPFGLVLGFKVGLGLIGLWVGLTVALVFVGGIGLYCEPIFYVSLPFVSLWKLVCTIRTNWDEEVRKAMARLGYEDDLGSSPNSTTSTIVL